MLKLITIIYIKISTVSKERNVKIKFHLLPLRIVGLRNPCNNRGMEQ